MIETRFKDTEIGRIPEDWTIKEIGQIADYRRGSFPQPYGLPQWYGGPGAYPFVQVADVSTKGFKLNEQTQQTISALAQKMSVYVPKGSVLVTLQGSIGRVAITQYDSYVDRTLAIFRSFKIEVDKEYFAHKLSEKFLSEAKAAPGGIIKTITKEVFSGFGIAIATKEEQTRIASALTSIDNLISSLDKLIEKKKNIKQGTMQQLLTGKKRLKGFSEPWEEKKMWEVTIWDKKFNGVASYMQKESIKYPYVLANVFEDLETHGGDVLLLSTGNYVGWTTVDKAGRHLCEGEIVAIPWGGVANVKYAKGKFVTADNRIATSSDRNILNNKFLYYQMLYREDEINAFYRGASIKHPSMLDVLTMTLQIPKIEEQKAIASVLTSMDNEISSLEAKKAKYESLKQGMMQQLLTGKIRLI